LLDLPFDVQMTEIEFDPETYQPIPAFKPRATRAQVEKALAMLLDAERPVIVAGGGVINANASAMLTEFAEIVQIPVIPTLMGWGCIPDDHPLMAGMVGLQTSHRYGNATLLAADFVFGIGNRWANRHTGSVEVYTQGRKFVHIDIEPTQIGRVFAPDFGITSDAAMALELLIEVAREWRDQGRLTIRHDWLLACQQRKACMLRRSDHADKPIKPMRVYEEMNRHFGRNVRYVSTIGLSRLLQPSSCMFISHVTGSTVVRPALWAGPFPPHLVPRWRIPRAMWSLSPGIMTSSSWWKSSQSAHSSAFHTFMCWLTTAIWVLFARHNASLISTTAYN
jgi:tartronate-semialdehyde synthase